MRVIFEINLLNENWWEKNDLQLKCFSLKNRNNSIIALINGKVYFEIFEKVPQIFFGYRNTCANS